MKTKILYTLIGILVFVHLVMLIPALQDPIRFQLRDTYDYLDLARTLLSTGHYQGTEYPGVDLLRPPGYPAFLLIGIWLSQGWTGLISLIQVLILFLTAWMVYRICAESGYRQAGLIAVIIYLLNPNAAFWSMVLLTETLAGFYLVFGMWCFVHYRTTLRRRWLFLAGLALAAGALTRPILLPLAIVLGVAFALMEWRRTRIPGQSIQLCLVFALGFLVLVLPWHIRNLHAYGRFTLSEVGDSTFQNWYVAKTLASAEGISRDEASAIIASSPNPMRYSLGIIRQYPLVFIKEQGRGILRSLLGAEYGSWAKVWGGQEISTTGVLSAFIDKGSPAEIFRSLGTQLANPWFWAGMYALIYDFAIYTATLIGFWRVVGNHRKELVFDIGVYVLLSLIYLLIIPGAAGESRFRVPADPLLALTAGMAFLPQGNLQVTPVKEPVE